MKVICISGKAMNGKDTSAAFIKDALEGDENAVLITHYADLLKHICRSFFDWNGEKDEIGRHILQYVGTDIIRAQQPNFWVDFLISVLKLFKDEWDYVLIPDCRFPNEIDAMREAGFDVITLRIIRPNFETPLTEEQQQHPSEVSLDNYSFDYTVYNDDTLDSLRCKMYKWVKKVEEDEYDHTD